MKRADAVKIWTLFATAYAEGLRWLSTTPDQDGTSQLDRTANLYIDFLEDLDYAAAGPAVRRLIATWAPTSANRYPPIPVVRAAVMAYQRGPRRAGGDAYGDLRKALSAPGGAESPRFADPVVERVVDALGWREYRNSDEGCPAFRARFIELYDQYAAKDHEATIVGALAPPLPTRALGPTPIAAMLPEPNEETR